MLKSHQNDRKSCNKRIQIVSILTRKKDEYYNNNNVIRHPN